MSVNKVILVGNLGRDPEMRHTQSGRPVANFTLATNERWRDRDGQQQERTEWHRIVLWDRLAEVATDYLAKGRQVYIEGRIQTREWEDRDGNKRYTTEIVGLNMQMLGRRGEGGYEAAGSSAPPSEDPASQDPASQDPASQDPASQDPASQDPASQDPAPSTGADDDIPF